MNAVTSTTTDTAPRMATPSIHPASDSDESPPSVSAERERNQQMKYVTSLNFPRDIYCKKSFYFHIRYCRNLLNFFKIKILYKRISSFFAERERNQQIKYGLILTYFFMRMYYINGLGSKQCPCDPSSYQINYVTSPDFPHEILQKVFYFLIRYCNLYFLSKLYKSFIYI